MSKDTKCWMAWALDVISEECMLRPPISIGTLWITDGKVCIIFNFGRRDLWSRAKIDLLFRILRTRDTNNSDGSQCVSWPKNTSCGKNIGTL